nr:MAG TPA: hypothetical protein [Caudoviricetes sp.]
MFCHKPHPFAHFFFVLIVRQAFYVYNWQILQIACNTFL